MADDDTRRALRRIQSKAWKDANREKVRAAGRAYSKAHREQSNAWKAANRDKTNAAARASYNPEKARAYYQKRRQEILDNAKARYLADTEAGKRRAKEWKANNQDRVLELRQAHYAANKAVFIQRAREWNAANPEATRSRGRNYRARFRGAEGFHTGDDIKVLFVKQRGRCVYCDVKLGNGYHVDHIVPLIKGGSNWPSNLQLTCVKCNNRKRATDPIEYARRIGLLI